MVSGEKENEVKKEIQKFAIDMLKDILEPIIDEAKEVLKDAVHATFEGTMLGRQTIDEWATIIIKGVDKVKNELAKEKGWHYVGGKLNFARSTKSTNKVAVSFELYYQDENKNWKKVGAESDMFDSDFTLEALEEIKSKGCVSFEVE